MVRFSKIQRLGVLPLLILLGAPNVSAFIINVVVSEVEEVWNENNDDTLRRKEPNQESIFTLCRPPPEEPWIGVYAIDPKVTSCEAENAGGSPNWDLGLSSWERPDYLPKPPGTVLQIGGPGPAGDIEYAISNTENKEDFLLFRPAISLETTEPSKWLVERYGNGQNYEEFAEDNNIQVGDTLRFWDPELPTGFQQLYMHRIKGSPMRFNRLRPLPEHGLDMSTDDYAVELDNVRKEYPAAEFRIGSLGKIELVKPGSPVEPTRTQRFLQSVGNAGDKIGKLFSGISFRGQSGGSRDRIGSDERIPLRGEETRARSEEIEIDPGDVFGNPDSIVSAEELLRAKRAGLPQIPSLATLVLKKLRKTPPVQEVVAQFEESKSDSARNGDDDVRRPVDMERSSKSSNSKDSKMSESIRGRLPTISQRKGSNAETEYKTAFGFDEFDYSEEDRLGDILDENSNIIDIVNQQPLSNSQAGTGVVDLQQQIPPSDQSNT
ncbi:hypothetical protein TWF481_009004 [Arthrobotrys musiformis]|uniref:Uncharacterized protein n=1 Tax=Arthrobotrys musiformis TaxID=47236 RepID=A0AAV9W2G4_9PEZI